jgi:hypothetical protein
MRPPATADELRALTASLRAFEQRDLGTLRSPIRVHYCGSAISGVQSSLRAIGQLVEPSFVPNRRTAGVGWTTQVQLGERTVLVHITADAARQHDPIEDPTQLLPAELAGRAGLVLEFEALGRADGLVFVVDSQLEYFERTRGYLRRAVRHLARLGRSSVPCVAQLNKRDLPSALSVGDLLEVLPLPVIGSFESVATTGEGVSNGLAALVSAILEVRDSSK